MFKTYATLRGFEIYRSCEVSSGDGETSERALFMYIWLQNYSLYKFLFRDEYTGSDGWIDGDGSGNNMDLHFEDA
jgi:hypothetical protein